MSVEFNNEQLTKIVLDLQARIKSNLNIIIILKERIDVFENKGEN